MHKCSNVHTRLYIVRMYICTILCPYVVHTYAMIPTHQMQLFGSSEQIFEGQSVIIFSCCRHETACEGHFLTLRSVKPLNASKFAGLEPC
jgi:hypothetical protein